MKKNVCFFRKSYAGMQKLLNVMKLTIFILLTSVISVFAGSTYSQTKILNLTMKNSTVKEVLQNIETQSEFYFMYSEKLVDVKRKVSVNARDQKINDLLDDLFAGTDVRYKIKDRFILLTTPELKGKVLTAGQQKIVFGKVTDFSGQPLPGVTIIIKGTTRGIITDTDGNYRLDDIPDNATLVFSFVGMKEQEIIVRDKLEINVVLEDHTIGLEEIVAVGYGTQKKRDVTGSVQSIKTEELEDLPVAQIAQKLQGRTSGVEISQTTGIPGQGMTIRVRGAASINASNQPLYVVDGFPIVGDINSVNPDEVESISVLKDASAASLYGARAANGVVLIQTKKGKKGQKNIKFNAYYGVQTVPQQGRPDMMNACEFATFQKEIREEYADYMGTTADIPEEYQNPEQYGKGTDWYNILLRNATIENYSLSATINKNKFNTAVIGGYLRQEGVLLNSDFQRYSLRINTKYQLLDNIEMGVNVAPSYSTRVTPNSDGSTWSGGVLESALLTSPICAYKNEDGTLPLTATGEGMYPNPNWYRVVQEIKYDTKVSHILFNAYINYEIIDGLNFKSSINADLQNSEEQYFRPSTSGSLYAAPPQETEASITNESYFSWLSENTLTYSKVINDNHHFDALLGYTIQKYSYDYNYLYGTDFPDDDVSSLNAAATTEGSSDIEKWSLLSWVGRLNYNYKNRYLISLAVRRDGSSRFGAKNRWGNFPSISAGWIASDEEFMTELSFLSYLKLRGSYGLTGNNDIGNYTYYASVENANYVLDGTLYSGKATTSLSNNELGWEKTKQLDIGVDIGLFKDRIFFQYDYFKKNTTDMLYSMSVPQESGYDEIITNLGEIHFWGHEFAVTTKNLVNKLKWNTDFNISFVRNKVIDLGDVDYIGGTTSDTHISQVGRPLGEFYGYIWEGVYMDEDDYNNSPKHSTSQMGTVKMKDVSKDEVIDSDDRTYIGDPAPKFTFGLTNSFQYKDFDLSIVISGAYGNKVMNRTLESIENLDGVFNVTKACANRWRSPENPGDGILPRAKVATALSRQKNSRWVSDASYATIKNITFGYNLPFKFKKYFQNIRIYTSIQQALVITQYDGSNPEVSDNGDDPLSRGVDWSNYPVPRTLTFGVNVNFK